MQVEASWNYWVREVAEHFEVSVATTYRTIESGQLAGGREGRELTTLAGTLSTVVAAAGTGLGAVAPGVSTTNRATT